MLSNHIKIAWRNLLNHKFYSLLNIIGLSLGLTTCMTVTLIIREQYSYDIFHADIDRIFRINSINQNTKIACAPFQLGPELLQNHSVVEAETHLMRNLFGVDAVSASNLTLPVSGYFADPTFFDLFSFQLEIGNAATALLEPNTLVLSHDMAECFFGKNNPIGQTLTLKTHGSAAYRITGVVAEPPGKSHLKFDCLVSQASLAAIESTFQPGAPERVMDNWKDIYSTFLYVRLAPGKTQTDLDNTLTAIAEAHNKTAKPEEQAVFFSQNLGKISPQQDRLANDPSSAAPWFFIWGLSAFMVLLLVFPSLNYANMAVARALARTREVGVRKAIGARVSDVRAQFLTEALLTSGLALLLSGLLHLPLNQVVIQYFPAFTNMQDLQAKPLDWAIFIVLALAVGLLAGWIPAKRLSKIEPSLAIRGNLKGLDALRPSNRRMTLRSTMLIGQFAVSLVFIILVTTIWSQVRFMTLADYGFNKENLLNIELQGNKADILAAELQHDPHVVGTASASILLASNNLQGMELRRERGSEDLGAFCVSVGHEYLDLMGLQLIAGEKFPADASPDRLEYVIINEKTIEKFQLGSPAQAIGQRLWVSDSATVRIVGVVKDFHYRAMNDGIDQFVLRFKPSEHRVLHVKLASGDPGVALASLESIWKKIDPVHPFKSSFMEASVEDAYKGFAFVGGLISFFSFLMLSLAFLGLLASVTHSMGAQVKEIGIRKVLGASVAQVAVHLSRRFLVILGVAIALALPAGYALSNLFLQLFAYRISVGGLLLGGCAAALVLLGLTIVGSQAIKAALANPVQSLRSE